MKKLFLIPVLTLFLSACGSNVSQSNLHWGNYSNTLYNVKNDATEEASLAHEKELLSIVEQSNSKNLKVPPGIYAELGIYALKKGDKAAADGYFNLEQENYPEGKTIMQQVYNLF